MANLPPGRYLIKNLALGDGYIGRPAAENYSLLPKPVYKLAEASGLPGLEDQKIWTVEKAGDRSILSISGSPTAIIDQKIYAILIPDLDHKAEEWVIEHRPDHDAYVIRAKSHNEAWFVPKDEPNTQVVVSPWHDGPVEPLLLKRVLFTFTRIDCEE